MSQILQQLADATAGDDDREAMKLALEQLHRPLSANVTIDDQTDVLTIFGVKIAGHLLRRLSEPTPADQAFRVVKVKDGVATVETIRLFEKA